MNHEYEMDVKAVESERERKRERKGAVQLKTIQVSEIESRT
jgi:hypothetical protein